MGKRKILINDSTNVRKLLEDGERIPVATAWARFELYMLSRNRSESTIHTYMIVFRRFLEWRDKCSYKHVSDCDTDLKEITTEDIELYVQYLALDKRLNASTINTTLKSLKSLWSSFSTTYKAIENVAKPVIGVKEKPHELLFVPTEEQIKEALDSLDVRYFINLRTFAAVTLATTTGMRLAEIQALTLQHLDFGKMEILVYGKGGKLRQIPISQTLKNTLDVYLDARKQLAKSDAVFITQDGTPLSVRSLSESVKSLADWVGIPLTFHSFRRYFARKAIESGMHILTLQSILGHSDLSMLKEYILPTESEKRLAINRMGIRKGKE